MLLTNTLLDINYCLNFMYTHFLSVPISAGAGRTGTYLALQYLLAEARHTGQLNVCVCVERLRQQRMRSVQTAVKKVLYTSFKLVYVEVKNYTIYSVCTIFKVLFIYLFICPQSKFLIEQSLNFKYLHASG